MRQQTNIPNVLIIFGIGCLLALLLPVGCSQQNQSNPPDQSQPDASAEQSGNDSGQVQDAAQDSQDAQPETQADEPPPPPEPPDLAEDSPCVEPEEFALFVSPRRPMANQPLRIMIVSDEQIENPHIWARSPSGEVRQLEYRTFWGPPFAMSAIIENLDRGTWRVAMTSGNELKTCEDITARTVRPYRSTRDTVWNVEYEWDRRHENLYSAWIMQLFQSDPEHRPSWSPLHEVLRDPERNWLYNRLGMNEDGPDEDDAVSATPDCADTPYYLRAYFAWKMRLLFVFSGCSRGRGGEAPECYSMLSNLEFPRAGHEEVGAIDRDADLSGDTDLDLEYISEVIAFNEFMNRVVIRTVQSGAGRIMPHDNRSDLYSIELTRESIRPGTIFVDPYGHLLVVSQWIDQGENSSGMLFAIDGHPDLSIGRKRFWQGAFLFVDDLSWGAGGFKAFRPVFIRRSDRTPRRLTNAEIDAHPEWGNFSDEQYNLGIDGFYERMDRVINPNPLDPVAAQQATLEAFFELVQERVDSVVAGERYMAARSYRSIEMPEGSEIFETSGAWEDFSTPARDLRLLIAIDLVSRFPNRVISSPSAFSIPSGTSPQQMSQRLRQAADEYLRSHFITYQRSNGTDQRLSLATVIERQGGLEMGYNPNDCIEIRWAAPDGSPEMSSCGRHAPIEQLARMRSYREWFHTRRRPQRR